MTRAHDIIASHGGNPARWPDAERAAVLAALRTDAGLRTGRRDALALDTLLDEWATRDLGYGDARAAAARVLATPAAPGRGGRMARWAGAGSIAAVLAVAVGLGGGPTAPTAPASPAAPALAATAISYENAFAALFTTTPDEESVI